VKWISHRLELFFSKSSAFKNRKSAIVTYSQITLTCLIVPFHLSLSLCTWFKSLNRALSRDDPKAIISVLRLCRLGRAVSTKKQTGDQKKSLWYWGNFR